MTDGRSLRPASRPKAVDASDSPITTAKVLDFQPRPMRWKFSSRSAAVRLFITCWLIFAAHFATNTVREIYPALSLAENLSFDVSPYAGLHPDIFTLEGRGTFINNNPGASIMGAVPYALLRPITDRIVSSVQNARASSPHLEPAKYDSIYPMAQEFYQRAREKGFDVKFGLAAAITQSLVMAPISALSVVLMFYVLLHLTGNIKASVLLALLYAFATPIFYRTAQLNQNVLLAHFAFFSFVLLWRFWNENRTPFYFLAGLCAGWTVVLDYSGLVAVAALSGYAVARWRSFPRDDRDPKDLFRFVAGLAFCAAILMAYQWLNFGNPILPAQSYMPQANFTDLGYRGFSLPQADLLSETAFGMRYGLFTSAPILLLAFVIPAWLRKENRLLESREAIFVVSFTVLFFLFCAANQYGRMQFNTGVRHIVPVVPFVFLLTATVTLQLPRALAVMIGLITMYWSWCLTMHRDVEQGWGILESVRHITLEGFQLPWLETLERMGFIQNASVIPIFALCAAVIWVLWSVRLRPNIGTR